MSGDPQDLEALVFAKLKAIAKGDVSKTARQGGIPLRHLNRLRAGDNTDVRLSMLAKLARGLETTPAALLTNGAEVSQPQRRRIDEQAIRRAIRKLAAAVAVIRGAVDALEAALPAEAERPAEGAAAPPRAGKRRRHGGQP